MRQVNFLPFFILIFVMFLVDLYVFRGIKELISDVQNEWVRRIVLFGHWFIFAGMTIWLLLAMTQYGNVNPTNYKYAYFLVGLMLLFYLPKLVFSVFILSDDIIAGVRYVIAFVTPSKIESQGETVTRIKFIYQLGAGVASLPFIGAAYGMLKGRFDYNVKTFPVSFANLPKSFHGLKMVQISDLHLGSFFGDKTNVRRALKMINDLEPDIIVVTGDWVNNYSEEAETWIPEFKSLKAKIAKIGIVGNHDYGDYSQWPSEQDKKNNFSRLLEIHKEMGFQTLMNDNVIIENGSDQLAIVGVENWGVKPFPQHGDLDKAKMGTENAPVKILLSHDPSHFEEVVLKQHPDIDLTLSGHTHGAQFGVELGNVKWSPVKYKYPRWAGMYEEGHQRLYVNRGFGYLGFPGRIGMPPEITLFEFQVG